MELWSLYQSPPEHPDQVAARKLFAGEQGLEPADLWLFRTLQEARAFLARRGLYPVPRGDRDEPALVESWV